PGSPHPGLLASPRMHHPSIARRRLLQFKPCIADCRSTSKHEHKLMPDKSVHTSQQPRIHYVVSGHGPHVTLVHGVGANLQSWDEVAARLDPSFTVVRLDLRGHGNSG